MPTPTWSRGWHAVTLAGEFSGTVTGRVWNLFFSGWGEGLQAELFGN